MLPRLWMTPGVYAVLAQPWLSLAGFHDRQTTFTASVVGRALQSDDKTGSGIDSRTAVDSRRSAAAGRKVCCKVSLYIKTVSGKVVAQSIAFRAVSKLSIYWHGDDPFPMKSCLQVTCPLLSMVSYERCQNA